MLQSLKCVHTVSACKLEIFEQVFHILSTLLGITVVFQTEAHTSNINVPPFHRSSSARQASCRAEFAVLSDWTKNMTIPLKCLPSLTFSTVEATPKLYWTCSFLIESVQEGLISIFNPLVLSSCSLVIGLHYVPCKGKLQCYNFFALRYSVIFFIRQDACDLYPHEQRCINSPPDKNPILFFVTENLKYSVFFLVLNPNKI